MDSVKLKIAEGVHIPFNKDLMLNIMLCIAWVPILLLYVRGVYIRVPFIGEENVDKAIAISVVISVLCALPALINRFCLFDYIFYILNVFYLLSCYVFFPENEPYLNEFASECIFCVFTYYFIGRLFDIEKIWSVLLILSTICIFADIYYYIIFSPQHKAANEIMSFDNMDGAYKILPHVALLLWSTLEKFRIWKVLVTLVGVIFLLSCGTRGPLLCLGFFGIVYFLFFMNFKGAIYVKAGILTIAALLIATLNTTLYYITLLFTNLNLSTRILEFFATGDMGNDTSRSVLRDNLEHVLDNGDHFWGLGAFGSRNYNIVYSHFLPLDLACTYGYFLGYILLFLLTCLIVTALWMSRGSKRQVFIVFLFSISIVKLMLSNLFLMEPFFYMLIGACMTEIINKQHSTKQNTTT